MSLVSCPTNFEKFSRWTSLMCINLMLRRTSRGSNLNNVILLSTLSLFGLRSGSGSTPSVCATIVRFLPVERMGGAVHNKLFHYMMNL